MDKTSWMFDPYACTILVHGTEEITMIEWYGGYWYISEYKLLDRYGSQGNGMVVKYQDKE
jgi:hypothetical protein